MRKVGLSIVCALFALSAVAFPFGKKVTINGEKMKLEDGLYAKLETTLGDILIELNAEKAPMTTANFVMLAEGTMPEVSAKYKEKPYYDGLIFHRVIPGFMIQGGDPDGNGQGGPGYEFPNETSDSLPHDKGVISMANAGPHTNGSQFFITVAETKQLNGGYSVFGKVLKGQFVADSISNVARDNRDKPDEKMVMKTVTIIRIGKEFKKWDALAAFNKGKEDFEIAQKEEAERLRIAQEEAAAKAELEVKALLAQYPNAQKSSSGLMFIIIEQGKGEKPADGEMVDVHYAGYFSDGQIFDTSIKDLAQKTETYNAQREPYAPMSVPYGASAQLIPGFKEGVSMLNVGGKAKLIIPPHLAYGEKGAGGVIPPNAWLVFDIELESITKQAE